LISTLDFAIAVWGVEKQRITNMATREDLEEWVCEALDHHGGMASVLDVSKYIWDNYEDELRASGSLFYGWQYDIRWAAKKLRDKGRLAAADDCPRGMWALRA
jgi:hypothetical protein